jgi:hypothetical protein
MNKTEFIASLTPAQKEEFNTDIENLIIRTGIEYNFDSSKVAEVNTNMRLQNEVYLNVTLLFHVDSNGKVAGNISEIKRFNTVDEYLDSMNQAKNPPEGFKNIKM